MVRWVRIVAFGVLLLSLIGLGVGVGLFVIGNDSWIAVEVPPWLDALFPHTDYEVWLPGLIAGWLLSVLLLASGLVWSLFYVWRRRQYEGLIRKLEGELADLRNLPFTNPAPFEDLPERPDPEAARIMNPEPIERPHAGELEA